MNWGQQFPIRVVTCIQCDNDDHPTSAHDEDGRVWLVFCTGANTHVLPVTLERGVYTLAFGHYVSPTCGCEPVLEDHPLGGSRLVSHTEPLWPGSEQRGRLHA